MGEGRLARFVSNLKFRQKELGNWLFACDFAQWGTSSDCESQPSVNRIKATFIGSKPNFVNISRLLFDHVLSSPKASSVSPLKARRFYWVARQVSENNADLIARELPPFFARKRPDEFLIYPLVEGRLVLEKNYLHWYHQVLDTSVKEQHKKSGSLAFRVIFPITTQNLAEIKELKHVNLAGLAEELNTDSRSVIGDTELSSLQLVVYDDQTYTGRAAILVQRKGHDWQVRFIGVSDQLLAPSGIAESVVLGLILEVIRRAYDSQVLGLNLGKFRPIKGDAVASLVRQLGVVSPMIPVDQPLIAVKALTQSGRDFLAERNLYVIRYGKLIDLYKPRMSEDLEAAQSGDENHRHQMARDATSTVTNLGLSMAVAMALGLILRMLMPRALGPEKLGIFYFSESICAMFFTFLPLGLSTYIAREVPGNRTKAQEILTSVSPAILIFAVLIWLAMVAFLLVSGTDTVTLYCSAAMGIYGAVVAYQKGIIRRVYLSLGESSITATQEVGVRFLLVILIFLALFGKATVVGIAICYAISEIAGLIHMLFTAKKDGLLSGKVDLVFVKKMIWESLPFFGAGALVEIYSNVDVSMLRFNASNLEVALYGAASKLKAAGLLLIPIMHAALQPALARTWRDNKQEFQLLVTNAMRMMVAMALPMTLGLMVIPDLLSDFLFGKEFLASFRAISYLAPVLLLTYLNVLMGSCLGIASSGKGLLVVVAISVLLNILLNFILIPIGISSWGLGGGAAGASLATVISELFVLLSMKKVFHHGLDYWQLIGIVIISTIPCLALGLGFSWLIKINPFVRLAIIIIAAPLYVYATDMIRKEDIMWFLRIKRGLERRKSL